MDPESQVSVDACGPPMARAVSTTTPSDGERRSEERGIWVEYIANGETALRRVIARLGFAEVVPLWPQGRSKEASLTLARWGYSTGASAFFPSRTLMSSGTEVEWTNDSLLGRGDVAMPRSSASRRRLAGEPSGSLSGDAGRLLLEIRGRKIGREWE